jgi:outer membrane protein
MKKLFNPPNNSHASKDLRTLYGMLLAFILPFFVLCFATGFGQAVVVSAPEDCIKYAREHNRELQLAVLNNEMSHQNIVSARAALLPRINVTANLDDYYALPTQLIPAQFFGGRPGEFRLLQFGTRYQGAATADVSLPLINTTYWNNLKSAGVQDNIAREQVKSKEMDITERIYTVYYMALLSQNAITIAQKDLNNNDSLLYVTQNKFNNGIVESLELNRAKANRLQTRSTLDENKLRLLKNINSLKQFLGLDAKATLTVNGNMGNETIAPETAHFHLENYPMYRVKKLNTSLSNISLRTEQYKRLPEISIYTRYTKQLQTNDLSNINDNNTFNIGYSGIKLDLPIFSGFNRNAMIAKAKINQRIAQLDFDDYVARASIADSELVANYNLASSSLQNSKETLALAESNNQTALYKYQNGVYGYDQLINVYNELLNAQNQYLARMADYLGYRSSIQTRNRFTEDQAAH